jgi:hypothetical protein
MSFNICTTIKKTRVAHKCCNGHHIPANQTCYKYAGVEDGTWYNFYMCVFCKTVSMLLNTYEINNEESNIYSDLEHYFNIYINPKKIDLSKKIVSFFVQNDIGISGECITMSFEEFYSFLNRNICQTITGNDLGY